MSTTVRAPTINQHLSSCVSNQSQADKDSDQTNAFVAILKISTLKKEDEQYVHKLTVRNELGTTSYTVRIANIEGEVKVQNIQIRNCQFSESTGTDDTAAIVGSIFGAIAGFLLLCYLFNILRWDAVLDKTAIMHSILLWNLSCYTPTHLSLLFPHFTRSKYQDMGESLMNIFQWVM